MNIDEFTRRLDRDPILAIGRDDLSLLLQETRTLRDHDTSIAGRIRILEVGSSILIQEQNPEGELFVRELPSEEAAQRFVEARLAAYERMWDG